MIQDALQQLVDIMSQADMTYLVSCLKPELSKPLQNALAAGQLALRTAGQDWSYWDPPGIPEDSTIPKDLVESDLIEAVLEDGESVVMRANFFNWGDASSIAQGRSVAKYRKL